MRESCISHKSKSLLLVIREDYYRLTKCDKVLSALLSIFEYWANGEIAYSPDSARDSIDLGVRTIAEMEKLTLWIATDKQIRTKVKELKELGFISICKGVGNQSAYSFHIAYLQQTLDGLDWSVSLPQLRKENPQKCPHHLRLIDRTPSGQLTAPPPVNKPHPSGQLTAPPPVNKPHPSGQLTESLYIEEKKNIKKECVEAEFQETTPTRTRVTDFEVCVFEEEPQQINPTTTTDINQPLCEKTDFSISQTLSPAQVEVEANSVFDPKLEELISKLDRGELKDLPTGEKKQLANYLMGSEIKLYRKSGYIQATDPNDISVDFLRYVAWKDLKQPDNLTYARNTIRKYERDITAWGQIVDLVQGWQTVTPEKVAATASARVQAKRGSKEDLQIAIQHSLDTYKTAENPFRRKA